MHNNNLVVKEQMGLKVSHLTLVKETDFQLGIVLTTSKVITAITKMLSNTNNLKGFKETS